MRRARLAVVGAHGMLRKALVQDDPRLIGRNKGTDECCAYDARHPSWQDLHVVDVVDTIYYGATFDNVRYTLERGSASASVRLSPSVIHDM